MQASSARSEPQHSSSDTHAALHLLAAVLSASGNPFVTCKRSVAHLVHFHFMHFAKLFHARLQDNAQPTMCRLHLQVNLAFSQHVLAECTDSYNSLACHISGISGVKLFEVTTAWLHIVDLMTMTVLQDEGRLSSRGSLMLR